MKNKRFNIKPLNLALLLAGIGMAQASHAVDLMAVEGSWTPAGGTPITMWGFAAGNACPTGSVGWNVGPQLTDTDLVGGDLTINLLNCLSEPVSIVIPGQSATFTPVRTADGRVKAFTTEAAPGLTQSYIWTGVKPGTYLYQSGSHPAKQVQMGLYGALTVGGYPDTSGDVTLLYSEIDPELHNPPAAATPLGYNPRHYLVNGLVSPPVINAGNTAQPTVLRFLNAGLDFHVPTLNGGYMSLVTEDGYPYPFAKQQYSANVAAGKTIDALWQPATVGAHVIYDRRGNGMVASLMVVSGTSPGNDAPTAIIDAYDAVVGTPLSVGLPGVLVNDTDPEGDSLTASVVDSPINGTVTLNPNGSFTYATTLTGAGADSFTYKACDPGSLCSDPAKVTLTISAAPPNNAPVAIDDDYVVNEDTTLNKSEFNGVLGNDMDADGDSLGATLVSGSGPSNGVLHALNVDGSFDYTPNAHYNGSDSFRYEVSDGNGGMDEAVVTITVQAVDDPPVAVDDSYNIDLNATLNVTAAGVLGNDTDADGDNLTAILSTAPATDDEDFTFNADGSFSYRSNNDTRDTDSFTYEACDPDPGSLCTTAAVTININLTPTNTAPVANPDTANVVGRTDTFINLTGNDTDDDGNIDPNGIVITAAPNQRGTVVVTADGVDYTPHRNFRSNEGVEEEFSYTVRDLSGATSNEVTVTVTVFRRQNQLP